MAKCSIVVFLAILASIGASVLADIHTVDGLRDNTPQVYALIHAVVVQTRGLVVGDGTVTIRDGIIEDVGRNLTTPPDARVIDLTGKWVYPGFIDAYVPAGKSGTMRNHEGVHWSPNVHPETRIAEVFKPSADAVNRYRREGFLAGLVFPDRGIFRGQSAVFLMGNGSGNDVLLKRDVAQHLALLQDGWDEEGYPDSLMGAIALMRQTLLDAQWYSAATQAFRLNPAQPRPAPNLFPKTIGTVSTKPAQGTT